MTGELWAQPYDAFRYTMAVNLEAPFLLSQEASRDMREAGWGRIVMVSSTAGQIGSPRNISYTTSKHALLGLMRAAAQDVGTFGGTCNAVLPGWVLHVDGGPLGGAARGAQGPDDGRDLGLARPALPARQGAPSRRRSPR